MKLAARVSSLLPVCNWTPLHDGRVQCSVCGAIISRPLTRRCGDTSNDQERLERYLGDYTECLLSKIGITPDRYKAAKALFGFAPTCDCDKRKEWLNRVGEWWKSG